MKLFCVILICSQWLSYIIGREKPLLDCPGYVPEGGSARCICTAPQHVLKPFIYWLQHAPSPILYLTNVRRWENDTQYTCLVTGDGYQGSTDYILRVAYGPSVEHLTIGQSTFVTNGSQTFNLTCNATDVYPPPNYQWSGIACENESSENVCTFTPDPVTDDQKNVTCTAVGSYGDRKYWKHPCQAIKQLQLNLTYPPSKKPTIHLQVSGRDYIQKGDKLTCTVAGGKPLVDSVHFHCTNPDLRGEDEERSELSISSSVTVTSASTNTMMGMTCFCKASWKTRPEYYQFTSTAVYLFARAPSKLSDKALEMANGGISFTLEAHPVPDTFHFVNLGNQMSAMASNLSEMFSPNCTHESEADYLVTCTVTPVNVAELTPGHYKVSVSNGLGSVDVAVLIQNRVPEGAVKLWTVVLGASVGFVITAGIVIVVVAIFWRKRQNRRTSD